MKLLKILMLPLLFSSIAAHAASYCDSKATQQATNDCYRQSILTYKKGIDKSLTELMAMPGQTAQSKEAIERSQSTWEIQVQNTCRDFSCFEYQFIGRLTQINRLKEQQGKNNASAQPIKADQCLAAWVHAYRQEEGEDAMVTADQSSEWEDWCRAGKLP
ncbi:hypothetical protein ACQR3P_24185 [Rhodococcus sp. IEGM1300]